MFLSDVLMSFYFQHNHIYFIPLKFSYVFISSLEKLKLFTKLNAYLNFFSGERYFT